MNYETNLAMTFNNYALFSQEVFVLFLTLSPKMHINHLKGFKSRVAQHGVIIND